MFKGICALLNVDRGVTHGFIHAVIAIKVNLDRRKACDEVTITFFNILLIKILLLNLRNASNLICL